MATIKAVRNDANVSLTPNNTSGYTMMNRYGHLYVEIKNFNNNSLDIGSGNLTNNTQRICIATDDIPIANIQNYMIDNRFNSNYRYKTCGSFSTLINSDDY